MYQTPPPCINIVHVNHGQVTFSCLTFSSLSFDSLTAPLVIFGVCIFILVILLILRWILSFKIQLTKDYAVLEITPPKDTKQTIFSTEQFLTTLHSLGKQSSIIDRLFGNKKRYSLEVVSTKEKGIRFLVRAQEDDIPVIKKNIISFLPDVKIQVVDDYLAFNDTKQYWKTVSLKLSQYFSLPLQEQIKLSQHDPIGYITGQMTKLAEDELIVLQYILKPTKRSNRRWFSTTTVLGFVVDCCLFLILTPITLAGAVISNGKGELLPLSEMMIGAKSFT